MQRYNNVMTLAIPKNKVLNPNRSLDHNVQKFLHIYINNVGGSW